MSNDCLGTLIQDRKALSFSQASAFALSDVLSQSFSSQEQDNLGVTIPIDGVPVALDGQRAQNIAQQFFQQTGLKWDQETSLSIFTSTLSENAVEAYKACILGQKTSGPKIIAYDATDTEITVKISWQSPPAAPTSSVATYTISGGKPQSALPKTWRTGQSNSFIFSRDSKADFRMTVNIGGEEDHVFVPFVPTITVKRDVIHVTMPSDDQPPLILEGDGSGNNQEMSACYNAPDGYNILQGTASVEMLVKVGNLDNTSKVEITTDDGTFVCWHAFLRPLSKEGGGNMRWRITFLAERWTFTVG
jgi:hypothetical protein